MSHVERDKLARFSSGLGNQVARHVLKRIQSLGSRDAAATCGNCNQLLVVVRVAPQV